MARPLPLPFNDTAIEKPFFAASLMKYTNGKTEQITFPASNIWFKEDSNELWLILNNNF